VIVVREEQADEKSWLDTTLSMWKKMSGATALVMITTVDPSSEEWCKWQR